jgi:hypothetical protein
VRGEDGSPARMPTDAMRPHEWGTRRMAMMAWHPLKAWSRASASRYVVVGEPRSEVRSGTGCSGEEVGTRELRLPVIGLATVICKTWLQ